MNISAITKSTCTIYEFDIVNPLLPEGDRVQNVKVEVWEHDKTNEDDAYSVICVNDDPTPYKGKLFDYAGEAHRQARLLIKELHEKANKPAQKLLPAPVQAAPVQEAEGTKLLIDTTILEEKKLSKKDKNKFKKVNLIQEKQLSLI